MKLIRETVEDVHYLKEETESGEKKYFIEGIFMQGDIKNRNGRVYPSEVLKNEVERYKSNHIDKKRAFGELGHPNGPNINLDRVSHMIVDLRQEGANFVGKAKVMDTPMGKIVKNMMDEDATIGVSSRGMGSLKANKQGIMEVQNDFYLATAGDIVADPSAPDAFVKGIMEEGAEWIFDSSTGSWRLAEEVEGLRKSMKKLSRSELEENKIAAWEKFIHILSGK